MAVPGVFSGQGRGPCWQISRATLTEEHGVRHQRRASRLQTRKRHGTALGTRSTRFGRLEEWARAPMIPYWVGGVQKKPPAARCRDKTTSRIEWNHPDMQLQLSRMMILWEKAPVPCGRADQTKSKRIWGFLKCHRWRLARRRRVCDCHALRNWSLLFSTAVDRVSSPYPWVQPARGDTVKPKVTKALRTRWCTHVTVI